MVKENTDLFEYQNKIIQKQDEDLDNITTTVIGLKKIAKHIGTELDEQNNLLDDMDNDVVYTTTRVNSASRRIDNVAKLANQNKHTICIALLLIILVLMIIIYFI